MNFIGGKQKPRAQRARVASFRARAVPLATVMLSASLLGTITSPPASATKVDNLGGYILMVGGDAGQQNDITVSKVGNRIRVEDLNATVTPDPSCIAVDPNEVDCPVPLTVNVQAGDLNDTVRNTTSGVGPTVILQGGPGDDLLLGDSGADRLYGNDGADVLRGKGGDDLLDGGSGPDVMDGGDGSDTINYYGRTKGIKLDADGVADDGEQAPSVEGDNAVNYEGVIGTNKADDIATVNTPGVTTGGRIEGNDGDDKLRGGFGDDVIDPGLGDDIVDGGAGVDTITYENRYEDVTVELSFGYSGERREKDYTSRVEIAQGGHGNDTFIGSRFNGETFRGGPGADTFLGGGDEGLDVVDYSDHRAGVTVTAGDGRANDGNASDGPAGARDMVDGSMDVIIGSPESDNLTGTDLTGMISAGAGDDVIDGGAGPDVLLGGDGFDTVSYASRTSAVKASLDGAPNDGARDVDPFTPGDQSEADALGLDIEALVGGSGDDQLVGGPSNDTLYGGGGSDELLGRAGDDMLFGGTGDDTERGEAGNDLVADGTSEADSGGNDRLAGDSGNDTLMGFAGDDTFEADSGADTILGGSGSDLVDYSSRVDPVTVVADGASNDGAAGEADNVGADVEGALGGSDDDLLSMGAGGGLLDGGAGDDVLDGGAGPDRLVGGPGSDTVSYASRTAGVVGTPGTGADDGQPGEGDDLGGDVEKLLGGAGPDLLVGTASANVLVGGAGPDTLLGGDGFDLIFGGDQADSIDGGGANDILAGEGGSDLLQGGPGDDELSGGPGDDLLDGGFGADVSAGGDGSDRASYATRGDDIYLTNDGVPDDGAYGEGDNVLRDVEGAATGAGNDRLNLTDGASGVVSCGAGDDRVIADPVDQVAGDCEVGASSQSEASISINSRSLRMKRNGRVAVKLSCRSGSGGCKGTLELRRRGRKAKLLGRRRFSISAGHSKRLSVRLKRVARRAVRRRHRLRVTVRAKLSKKAASKKATVKPAKRKRRRR